MESMDGRLAKRRLRLALVLLAALLPAGASARDMQGRLGLGYNAEFANFAVAGGVPGVSVKYGMTRDIAVEGVIGVATSNPGNSVTAVKFFKNLFFETSLNFYFMLGAGILSGGGRSGAEFLGGFGAEFFVPGLESLGLSIEAGASLDNLSGSMVLKTLGVSFLHAGIHFYF